MNSLVVKFSNLVETYDEVDILKKAIAARDIRDIIRIIYALPYLKNRELCLYIIDKLITKDQEKDFVRKKAA